MAQVEKEVKMAQIFRTLKPQTPKLKPKLSTPPQTQTPKPKPQSKIRGRCSNEEIEKSLCREGRSCHYYPCHFYLCQFYRHNLSRTTRLF